MLKRLGGISGQIKGAVEGYTQRTRLGDQGLGARHIDQGVWCQTTDYHALNAHFSEDLHIIEHGVEL
ncbi:hypothetical protein GCM10022631_37360 [Deinococcus rubellus]